MGTTHPLGDLAGREGGEGNAGKWLLQQLMGVIPCQFIRPRIGALLNQHWMKREKIPKAPALCVWLLTAEAAVPKTSQITKNLDRNQKAKKRPFPYRLLFKKCLKPMSVLVIILGRRRVQPVMAAANWGSLKVRSCHPQRMKFGEDVALGVFQEAVTPLSQEMLGRNKLRGLQRTLRSVSPATPVGSVAMSGISPRTALYRC